VKKLPIARKPLILNRETIRQLTSNESLLIRGGDDGEITVVPNVPKTTTSNACTGLLDVPCADIG